MSKIRVGNKANSVLNGEWAGHVRGDWKKITSGLRRLFDKKVIRDDIDLIEKSDNTLQNDAFKHLKQK